MPELELKVVQKELDAGKLWPVYWVHGPESMKARELYKRIRKTVLGEEKTGAAASFNSLAEDQIDGQGTEASRVVDSAQSLFFGGSLRLVVIRDAQALKNPEDLTVLFGPADQRENLTSVCVFFSNDFDRRKKISKLLLEKAAVISCEAVSEEDREAWIGYLCKRRKLILPEEWVGYLRSLDPWSLDIVERELEKLELMLIPSTSESTKETDQTLSGMNLQNHVSSQVQVDRFLDSLFKKDLKNALSEVDAIAADPEQSIPLLGLLAWNIRHLALAVADRQQGTRSLRLSGFLEERLRGWAKNWNLEEVLRMQKGLFDLDFGVKQTARLPLGLWAHWVEQSIK